MIRLAVVNVQGRAVMVNVANIDRIEMRADLGGGARLSFGTTNVEIDWETSTGDLLRHLYGTGDDRFEVAD